MSTSTCSGFILSFDLHFVTESVLQYGIEEYSADLRSFGGAKSVHVQAHFDGEPIAETRWYFLYVMTFVDCPLICRQWQLPGDDQDWPCMVYKNFQIPSRRVWSKNRSQHSSSDFADWIRLALIITCTARAHQLLLDPPHFRCGKLWLHAAALAKPAGPTRTQNTQMLAWPSSCATTRVCTVATCSLHTRCQA